MISLPKPRGFWDYALFALGMTGVLLFLFWLEASDGVRWIDVTLAFAAAVLCVLAIIFSRRAEKAKWISQPTRFVYLLAAFGAFGFMFGATYADAYLLHHKHITFSRLRQDFVLAAVLIIAILWSLRRQLPAKR